MSNLSDQEQADLVKRFWNDYGRFIVLAVVIGLLVGYGWKWWRQREINHQLTASALYSDYLQQSQLPQGRRRSRVLLKELQKNHPDSTYRAFTELFAAKEAFSNQKAPLAIKHYEAIIRSGANLALKNLARVRQARLLLSMHQPKQALVLLEQVKTKAEMMHMLVSIEKAKAFNMLGDTQKSMTARSTAQGLAKGMNDVTLPGWLFAA